MSSPQNSSPSLEHFAEQHRLKTRRDECNDIIIPGKFGQIYDHEDGKLLGVVYMPDPHGKHEPRPQRWNNRRKQLIAAGCQIKNNGDDEGIALFDPANQAQARLAIRVAGVKAIRKSVPPSPAQVAARLLFSQRSRPKSLVPALNFNQEGYGGYVGARNA